jgi:AhpD family alkylhydroperoxidase
MDERIKELVAIGASAAVNCHPCLELHLAEGDRLGIDREEVKAAVEVGLMVNKGAAVKTRARAEALLGLGREAPGGCCGG